MLGIAQELNNLLLTAMENMFPEAVILATDSGKPLDPQLIIASKPEFGDFQVNGPLALSKILGKPPRKIATDLVNALLAIPSFSELCSPPIIAGPGFINLVLKPELLKSEIRKVLSNPNIGVPNVTETEDHLFPVIIDFSSPNIAKDMHVGHLRSTLIGDCLARILEFRGYNVLRLNHVGDWGTQFGMLITHLKQVAPQALINPDVIELGDLVAFYRQAKNRFDNDQSFQIASREEVVRLQSGDPDSRKAWQLLCDQSRREFQVIYDRLDITITERGESFYNSYLEEVILDLDALDLLVTDEGARCVFLEGVMGKSNKPLPVIIQKSDGGFNYATTDLAAIRYRFGVIFEGDGASRIVYVTDSGQANHFAGIFQIARRAGWVPTNGRLEHVPFGLVQGQDGKKLKTRAGDTVRLKDLLDEAIERADIDLRKRLAEENRSEEEIFIKDVSKKVGIAAVKYADLSQNRITSYQFNFDRMLSLNGNTAPYLLYAMVRIAGILRKSSKQHDTLEKQLHFSEPIEWALVRHILRFDLIIIEVEEELLPSRLCSYLFELSQLFNRFYDQVPVLKAKEPNLSSRLILCQLTADTLKMGLNLLGIPTLERM
uniref:arginine--tRNA ligase n=1 Tax=Paulinella chromatophora TaxID=39717 RepID=B1X4B8_PAUCH|nr:arginyl-tRNA synthetase [Paulinella chromatophora]ACB42787.1 arginyl-tRNA synthetase [Paulinella chromatophora]